MKTLKYFLLAMVAFMAVSCSDDVFTPRDGEDDDDPVVIGGGNGTGQPGGGSGGSGGSGGGGGRMSQNQKNKPQSTVRVEL